ncbi:hypothetical protein Fcan01_08715 [Folsomia candida]|uniref:DUF4806 domain-containing protein n=1 Tax=Folsomia candida TaxID=158441 RepID=A0A226EF05_FOLCA|nr:hypothetical protein Fcan01_08715 [Folsomia candida]
MSLAVITSKPFVVLEFPEEQTVEAVPAIWLTSDKTGCRWPNKVTPSFTNKKKDKNSSPGDGWTVYKCRVLGEFDNYTSANAAAHKAEDTSELEVSKVDFSAGKRTRRTTQRPARSSSSDCEDLDKPSQANLTTTIPQIPVSVCEPHNNFIGGAVNEPGAAGSSQSLSSLAEDERNQLNFQTVEILPNSQTFFIDSSGVLCTSAPTKNVGTSKSPNSGFSEGFQGVIIRALARIEANQRDFRQILDELVLNQRSGATPHVEVDYSSLPKFPIESEADLTAFDVQLSIDTERKVFEQYLVGIGGTTLPITITEILERIFAKTLRIGLTYTGKGDGKKSYISFSNINTAIVAAVKRNRKLVTVPDDLEIKSIIMDKLRFCRKPEKKSSDE